MGKSFTQNIRIEAHAIWLAVRDPRTPLFAKLVGLTIAAYAFSPIDLIPDFIPILGLVDDAILIPLGIWVFAKLIPADLLAEHRATAELASNRPKSRWGMLIIIAIWALIAFVAYEFVMLGYD